MRISWYGPISAVEIYCTHLPHQIKCSNERPLQAQTALCYT